jgi:ferrous iron transport protein A
MTEEGRVRIRPALDPVRNHRDVDWHGQRSTRHDDEVKPFALGLAAEGQPVRVVSLRAGRNLDRRLADMGLNMGSKVSVVQRQGGGLIVARSAARIAVGVGMAMKILVVPA